jgi:hypothetical protein
MHHPRHPSRPGDERRGAEGASPVPVPRFPSPSVFTPADCPAFLPDRRREQQRPFHGDPARAQRLGHGDDRGETARVVGDPGAHEPSAAVTDRDVHLGAEDRVEVGAEDDAPVPRPRVPRPVPPERIPDAVDAHVLQPRVAEQIHDPGRRSSPPVGAGSREIATCRATVAPLTPRLHGRRRSRVGEQRADRAGVVVVQHAQCTAGRLTCPRFSAHFGRMPRTGPHLRLE